jgi:hypothetical protein
MHDKLIELRAEAASLRSLVVLWMSHAGRRRRANEELEWRVKRLEAELRGK